MPPEKYLCLQRDLILTSSDYQVGVGYMYFAHPINVKALEIILLCSHL